MSGQPRYQTKYRHFLHRTDSETYKQKDKQKTVGHMNGHIQANKSVEVSLRHGIRRSKLNSGQFETGILCINWPTKILFH